jgi:hypothetical protein
VCRGAAVEAGGKPCADAVEGATEDPGTGASDDPVGTQSGTDVMLPPISGTPAASVESGTECVSSA